LRRYFNHPVFTIADRNGFHRVGFSVASDAAQDWIIIHVIDPTRYPLHLVEEKCGFLSRAEIVGSLILILIWI
jgi:hypothetical protein